PFVPERAARPPRLERAMSRSAPRRPTPYSALAAIGLIAALGLGACSRSTSLTDPLAVPGRSEADLAAKKTKTPPPVPALSSPSDGATDVSLAPTLSWNASAGATSYRVQVSASSSFSTTVVDQSVSTTSAAISGLAGNTQHFWRVSARS